jgi:peptide/nickel transport system substrate-binding protein
MIASSKSASVWRRVPLLLALALAGVAAGSASAATGGAGGVVADGAAKPFVINYSLPPANIDPAFMSNLDTGFVSNFYVTLTQYGTKRGPGGHREVDFNKVDPYLAKSWKAQDGGKTWVFTLRKGAVFPDGTPMDSKAVKYSLDRLLTLGGIGGSILNGNRGVGNLVASIETPNATTVTFKLKDLFPAFPAILTAFQANAIVNPKIVDANGGVVARTPNPWMSNHTAGGGPYLLQSYDPNSRAVLVANPKFFGPKPREKRVIVNFISSDPTLLFQATAKKADVTVGLSYQAAASLRSNSCCTIVSNGNISQSFLSLPTTSAPFDNKVFRQALAYAVPSAAIVKNVLYGYGKSFWGPFPPNNTNFNTKLGKTLPFNVAKAKQLIQQSGVSTPVSLDLIIPQGENNFAQVAAVVKATWAQLGVNVNIKTLAGSAYVTARGTPKRNYSLLVTFGGVLGFPYWVTNYDARCGSVNNTSDWCNEKATALIDQAFLAAPAKQQALWDQFTRMWEADVPRIPLYSAQYVVVLKKGVKQYAYTPNPLSIWMWGR